MPKFLVLLAVLGLMTFAGSQVQAAPMHQSPALVDHAQLMQTAVSTTARTDHQLAGCYGYGGGGHHHVHHGSYYAPSYRSYGGYGYGYPSYYRGGYGGYGGSYYGGYGGYYGGRGGISFRIGF